MKGVPKEVEPIRARHDDVEQDIEAFRAAPRRGLHPTLAADLRGVNAHDDRGILLTIIDRQAKEFLAGQLLWKEHMRQRDEMKVDLAAARAELERLHERLRIAQHGEAEALKMMGAETVRAQALAAENARLANEVGILSGGIAAYRSGSYTLSKVWENGDGKQVPR